MNYWIFAGLTALTIGVYFHFTKKRELPKNTTKYDDL